MYNRHLCNKLTMAEADPMLNNTLLQLVVNTSTEIGKIISPQL